MTPDEEARERKVRRRLIVALATGLAALTLATLVLLAEPPPCERRGEQCAP